MPVAGREPPDVLLVERQRHGKDALRGLRFVELEQPGLAQDRVRIEEGLHREAALQIFAGEDERCGFHGRTEPAMGSRQDAAELREAALDVRIPGQERIEQVRPDVGHQGKRQDRSFVEGHVVIGHRLRVTGGVIDHRGRGDLADIAEPALLAEVQADARVHQRRQPSQLLFEDGSVMREGTLLEFQHDPWQYATRTGQMWGAESEAQTRAAGGHCESEADWSGFRAAALPTPRSRDRLIERQAEARQLSAAAGFKLLDDPLDSICFSDQRSRRGSS